MKEAKFYEKLDNNLVKCKLCNHYCMIADNKTGFCGVRQNKGGVLYSLVYGRAIAEHIDPIEKKPFFHFFPGSKSFSIATIGCNFACQHCQNADISQFTKMYSSYDEMPGNELSPESVVEHAIKAGCQSISYTYTEPTIYFEYALDTMKLAHENNLKNNWVTNGYITKEALKEALPYLDAANVDIKAISNKFYKEVCDAKLEPVLETLKFLKENNVWVEVTTLLIIGKNTDNQELKRLAKFIKDKLGSETPWHISRFFPSYNMLNAPATSHEYIYKAYDIGKKVGLKYVYAGNLPGDQKENTYCPRCDELNIERLGYNIKRLDKNGKCLKCGEELNLILK